MPGVSSHGGGGGGGGRRRRRSMNEINMVPFIDVMLVLLIIFMVTAPLITTGVVDLPSVGKTAVRPQTVIEVIVANDQQIQLKVDQQSAVTVPLAQLAARVRQQQGGADVPVIISADKAVRYDSVVRVMDTLQRAGVKRVGLSVRQGST